MKIEILCPDCRMKKLSEIKRLDSIVLKDKFECPSARISEGEYLFDLECYRCENCFDVRVSVTSHPQSRKNIDPL